MNKGDNMVNTGSKEIPYIHNITVEVIAEIEKELPVVDVLSLVFLLYDVPDTALQRLLLLQRVSYDINQCRDLNLLCQWASYAQPNYLWRYEFLEALEICQLYGTIKKIGLDVTTVREYYADVNLLHPLKRALYRLCEDMDSKIILKFKTSVSSYMNNVDDYESCELVILAMMSQKIITLNRAGSDSGYFNDIVCDIKLLACIIEKIPELRKHTTILRKIETNINDINKVSIHHSTPKSESSNKKGKRKLSEPEEAQDADEILASIKSLQDKFVHLKTDAKLPPNAYEIKNPKRVGLCYIINIQQFTSSKINNSYYPPLDERRGSRVDRKRLKHVMEALNFHVISQDNLTHNDFLNIQTVLNDYLKEEDSMFILCILSHGIEGHVFASDSVPVKIASIENLVDIERLYNKPKVFIIQACQSKVAESKPAVNLVADGLKTQISLKKSDFYVFWATAPEYEAYRDDKSGSVFIFLFIKAILEKGNVTHFEDLCIDLREDVVNFCASHGGFAQLPISKSTLRKKLYLQFPQNIKK